MWFELRDRERERVCVSERERERERTQKEGCSVQTKKIIIIILTVLNKA